MEKGDAMVATRTCETCKWCVMQDHGYSNYTVEGTTVHCLKKLHPEDGFDRWFGDDKRIAFANECAGYEAGEAVSIDCDREGLKKWEDPLSSAYTSDPEVGRLLDEWDRAAH